MRIYQAQREKSVVTVAQQDMAVLRRNFQFIRDEEEDLKRGEDDWEVRMSVRYYRKLFREYALADLSLYQQGKIGLRWRTEMEVVAGKGQFICGNKKCSASNGLHSYELLFKYVEGGNREVKQCLVKVRVCEACALLLFYRKLREEEREKEKMEKKKRKKEAKRRDGKRQRRSCSQSDESKSEDEALNDPPHSSVHERCQLINASESKRARMSIETKDDTEDDELKSLLL